MTGTPTGSSGVVPSAMAAPAAATSRSARPVRNRGQIRARNAAGPTTSSPNDCGDPIRPAPTAPARVARFQVRYRQQNVAVNPVRAASGSGWASETAVVSSMTPSARSSRPGQRGRSTSASRSPYSVLRLPSRIAPAVPASRLPPAAIAPASANCDAPVKASRLSAHACQTLRPALTAAAPNATPDTPTARPRPTPSRTGRG